MLVVLICSITIVVSDVVCVVGVAFINGTRVVVVLVVVWACGIVCSVYVVVLLTIVVLAIAVNLVDTRGTNVEVPVVV